MEKPLLTQSRALIESGLQQAFREARDRMNALTQTAYNQQSGSRWRPAEQLEHLILTTIPVVGALGKDRDWFHQFGGSRYADKDISEFSEIYLDLLNQGQKTMPN